MSWHRLVADKAEEKRRETKFCAQLLPSVVFSIAFCLACLLSLFWLRLPLARSVQSETCCTSKYLFSFFGAHKKLCIFFSCLYSTNRETSSSVVIKYSTKMIFCFWIQSVSNDEWPERIGEAEKSIKGCNCTHSLHCTPMQFEEKSKKK